MAAIDSKLPFTGMPGSTKRGRLASFLGVISAWEETIAIDVKLTLPFGLTAVEMASRLSSLDAIWTTKCSNFLEG